MKSSVAIALIVCGTILMATPYIHNGIVIRQVTDTMAALNDMVNVTVPMPKYANTACMVGGLIMIVVGAIAGLRSGKPERLQRKAVETTP